MTRQTITFVLDSDRDRDVLRWLEAQPNKSAAIRAAIRGRIEQGDVTLGDIYAAIQDLKSRSWAQVPDAQEGDTATGDEPPDVAATLDSLGL